MKRVIQDLKSWAALTLLVQKRFEQKSSPFLVTIGKPGKTHEQLGYFHSEVLPKLAFALHEAGEIKNNSEREAKYYLKIRIGFGCWIKFRDGVVFDPDSFAGADIDTLNSAIDKAIEECNKRNIHVNPPRERK